MNKLSLKCADGTLVSPIALGTLYFGSRISQENCDALLDTFFALGGRQIDTARSYADWLPGGESASERAIGRWLSARNREQVFLGTKGGLKPRGYNTTRGDLSQENMEKELKKSLEALQTDYIDLYWLHRDDIQRTPGEVVEMMNEWIRQGKIRYYGVSNWKTERIREANAYAAAHGLCGISASQIQYGFGACTTNSWGDSTIVCMNEREYREYQKLQIPVYAYSAQAEGYFPIYLKGGSEALSDSTRQKYDTNINRERAEKLRQLCEIKDISLSWLMAEYVLRSPFPAVFILGGSNEKRLREIMEYESNHVRQLTDEEWDYLMRKNEKQ
mgnify:FL=1